MGGQKDDGGRNRLRLVFGGIFPSCGIPLVCFSGFRLRARAVLDTVGARFVDRCPRTCLGQDAKKDRKKRRDGDAAAADVGTSHGIDLIVEIASGGTGRDGGSLGMTSCTNSYVEPTDCGSVALYSTL